MISYQNRNREWNEQMTSEKWIILTYFMVVASCIVGHCRLGRFVFLLLSRKPAPTVRSRKYFWNKREHRNERTVIGM